MFRLFLTIVLPLALPSLIYLFWLGLAQPAAAGQDRRGEVPFLWLIASGVLLLALVLVSATVHFGTSQPGTYVPPRWEGGRVVPGHIDPTHIEPGARP